MNSPGIACGISTALVFCLAACRPSTPQPEADLVLVNGTVITVDAVDSIAEAVAIRGSTIVAVGSNAEVEAFAGKETRRIGLGGRTVTPGLIDAHVHFSPGPLNKPGTVELSYPIAKSIEDIKAIILRQAAQTPVDGWIVGRGWDEGKLAERRLITAADLDEAEPDRPVWLSHTMGHYGTANSAALRLAGIDSTTGDPPAGTIDRDASGRPTGVLKETAQALVMSLVPAPTPDDVDRYLRQMAAGFNAECMTGAKDPGISGQTWDAYGRTLAAGNLSVRIFALWDGGTSVEQAKTLIEQRADMTRPYEARGDDRLIAGGVKIYADGSGGARTAWVHDDWNLDVTDTDAGNRGYPNIEPETLREMIRLYHDAGMHVSTHAIGDKAIDTVVDSYFQALQESPRKGLRHGIIHANIPSVHALEMMALLQRDFDAGYPEPSANFTWWIGDTYAGNFGSRTKRLNPFATYEKLGIHWANGSDYSVTPYAARYGIWSAIARRPALGIYGGDPFGREESVGVRTALKAVTIWAAHQLFLEDKTGSIEVGKYADLGIWDRNPYTIPTDEIKEMRCEMTVFNGDIVFSRQDEAGAR